MGKSKYDRPCRDFVAGSCTYPNCKFRHEHPAGKGPAGPRHKGPKDVCQEHLRGRCYWGQACRFSHESPGTDQHAAHREAHHAARSSPHDEEHYAARSSPQHDRHARHDRQDRFHPYRRPQAAAAADGSGGGSSRDAAGRLERRPHKAASQSPHDMDHRHYHEQQQHQQHEHQLRRAGSGTLSHASPAEGFAATVSPRDAQGLPEAAAAKQQLLQQPQLGRRTEVLPALERARFVCSLLSLAAPRVPIAPTAAERTRKAIESGLLFRDSAFADGVEQDLLVC